MKNQFTLKANRDIRTELKENGLSIWQVAAALDVTEGTVVRWLRIELSETEKTRIQDAIKKLKAKI